MTNMHKLTVQQLDQNGVPFRAFECSRYAHEIPAFLDRITRAYNMDHTQIYDGDKLIAGARKD